MKKIKIKNLKKGNDIDFSSAEACIDIDEYFNNKNKIIEKDYYDIVIELKALKENGDVECIFASYCNLIPVNLDKKNVDLNSKMLPAYFDSNSPFSSSRFGVKIKLDIQKLKVKNNWFKLHDIYGLDPTDDSNTNDCEACCDKKKNTIFLPCKHSFTCSDCSLVVRLPHNHCPVCRQHVSDCLIIDEKQK